MESILLSFQESLASKENRAQAVQMEAYMKNKFSYYGVKSPKRAEIFRPIWNNNKSTIIIEWKSLVDALWKKEQREYQMIALEIIKRVYKKMKVEDLDFLETLVTRKSWWDTVDLLASTSIGHLLRLDKQLQLKKVKSWIVSDDLWLQRVALIHQLKYKENHDLELLFYCIDQIKSDPAFFLRKGAGWALREASKTFPNEVRQYIKSTDGLSNLTIREGSKYL